MRHKFLLQGLAAICRMSSLLPFAASFAACQSLILHISGAKGVEKASCHPLSDSISEQIPFKATGQFLFVLVHQPSFLGSRFSPHSYDVHSSFLQSLFPRSLPHPSCLSPTSLPSPVSLCGLGCFGSCFFFSSPRIHPLDDSSFLVPSSSHPQMFIPPLCDLHYVQYQYIWLPILH